MLEAAELGLPEAQGEMAERFYYGQGGVDKDMVLCVEWARRAAQAGDSVGEFRIAHAFHMGVGGWVGGGAQSINQSIDRLIYRSIFQTNKLTLANLLLKILSESTKP